jgi:long-chain fatty acid transport protein
MATSSILVAATPLTTLVPACLGSEWFPIPYVAKNWSLQNDGNITAAFYGRGGMNTDWDDANSSATSYLCGANPDGSPASGPGPYCAGKAGVDLSQAFIALNYSAMAGDNFAWGIGPVFAVQMFEANGVQTFQVITKTLATTGDFGQVTSLSNNGQAGVSVADSGGASRIHSAWVSRTSRRCR